jgi:hypothetical protein
MNATRAVPITFLSAVDGDLEYFLPINRDRFPLRRFDRAAPTGAP